MQAVSPLQTVLNWKFFYNLFLYITHEMAEISNAWILNRTFLSFQWYMICQDVLNIKITILSFVISSDSDKSPYLGEVAKKTG